jgi:CDP-diacylglycerol--glycerol-3-phosphate 3-phosphatidyltransferase
VNLIPAAVHRGYMKLVAPVAAWLVLRGVSPNAITITGTAFWIFGGLLYGEGEIRIAGWLLGVTAVFDVVDGEVARASGKSSTFGAFLDSTLDRVSDAAVFGGLAYFYATSATHRSPAMLVVCLCGLAGVMLVSCTRAKAESVGLTLKVGLMQRPERVILLSAPQAFFGLALHGLILAGVIVFLTATAWFTVAQRVRAAREQ